MIMVRKVLLHCSGCSDYWSNGATRCSVLRAPHFYFCCSAPLLRAPHFKKVLLCTVAPLLRCSTRSAEPCYGLDVPTWNALEFELKIRRGTAWA